MVSVVMEVSISVLWVLSIDGKGEVMEVLLEEVIFEINFKVLVKYVGKIFR